MDPGTTINTDESLGCLSQPCLTSSVSDRESLAGTTLKVTGPFTSYDPTSKIVTAADGRRVQLLRPEKTKMLQERTKAWLKTLS